MSITTVTAAGDTCLPNIGLLASEVSEALGHGGPVQLDLSLVAAPDLSVLQVVQSARATAALAGQDISLAAPADGALAALLERAGFTTRLSSEDRNFWFHGDTAQ